MQIHDARPIVDQYSLDKEGLHFHKHKTQVANIYDSKEVERVYYPEVAELVKLITGAEEGIVFDHNVRSASEAQAEQLGVRKPVMSCHNDYTIASGPERGRDFYLRKRQKSASSSALRL